jgi:hypothetical protein
VLPKHPCYALLQSAANSSISMGMFIWQFRLIGRDVGDNAVILPPESPWCSHLELLTLLLLMPTQDNVFYSLIIRRGPWLA